MVQCASVFNSQWPAHFFTIKLKSLKNRAGLKGIKIQDLTPVFWFSGFLVFLDPGFRFLVFGADNQTYPELRCFLSGKRIRNITFMPDINQLLGIAAHIGTISTRKCHNGLYPLFCIIGNNQPRARLLNLIGPVKSP